MTEDEKKLTVILSDDLHRRVKIKAVTEGVSLSSVIRELLEEWASVPNEKQKRGGRVAN